MWCIFVTIISLFIISNHLEVDSLDESQFSIGNKPIQQVDEKFVSYTIDPAIFFTGLNHRPITLDLLKNLQPAFLRIAGPSTPFLEFNVNPVKGTKRFNDETTSLTFTPAMWWSFNEWIQNTNFTPIFAINDNKKVDGKWDAESIIALVDMTSKMNLICNWELGYDCSTKGFENYKDDLSTLRHMLDGFPAKRDKWQVVGSDLSKCIPSDHPEILRMYLADLQDAYSITWENTEAVSSSFFDTDVMQKLLSIHQASLPIWLSTPKCPQSITFDDGISWAIQMGEAAKNGFSVIFREPRIQEFYSATPAYWATVLHRQLMGRTVLDVKSTSLSHRSDAFIYAHCSKDQNSFSVRGAITIMIANNGSQPHKSSFRLPTQIKSVEVRSYILTASPNTTDTNLNNDRLILNDFKLRSKLRRAKVLTHLSLEAPPKSIAFFVLPGAKVPICIDNEDDTSMILVEIDKIQSLDFPDDDKRTSGLFSRSNTASTSLRLSDLHRQLESEFKMDAPLIPKLKVKSFVPPGDELRHKLKQSNIKGNESPSSKSLLDDARENFSNMKKKLDKVKPEMKTIDFKQLLTKDNEEPDPVLGMSKTKLDLDLSDAEVLKILGDRARAKFEKKIGIADFDEMFENVLKRKLTKRAINMDMLDEQVREDERKGNLPKPLKKLKNIEQKLTESVEEIEGLPDMSKIIPGFEKSNKKNEHDTGLFGRRGNKPKLDLFSLDTFEMPSLFSLLASKTTSTSTTHKPELDEQVDEEPSSEGNHRQDFFEHFGDKVIIQPKKHLFHDLGAALDLDYDDEDSLLDNEFIINDENDVSGAIERLENYFNDPSRIDKFSKVKHHGFDEYFEPAFDSIESFNRFKRNIIHEIKLNLLNVKNSIRANELRNKIIAHAKRNELPTTAERLSRRKFPNANNLSKKLNAPILEGLKRLVRTNQSGNKKKDVYVPKSHLPNTILKSYNSKLNWDEWQPEDILRMPTNYGLIQLGQRAAGEQVAFEDIPLRTNEINNRNARHVDVDVDSIENTIDNFVNTIDTIDPMLSTKEDHDYMLVLPGHGKQQKQLFLQHEKNGNTEIVLQRDSVKSVATSTDSNDIDSKTCPVTDFDTHTTTAKPHNVNNKGKKNRGKLANEKRINRSEFVQKIPSKTKPNKDADHTNKLRYDLSLVGSIIKGFNKFIRQLHDKVDTFFKSVE